MSNLSDKEINEFQDDLVSLQVELTQQYQLGKSAADTVVLDQSKVGRLSRMDAIQQQKMAQSSLQHVKNRLRNIVRAMAKITSGDYGFCDECGNTISSARLKVQPEAALCINCQSKLENR